MNENSQKKLQSFGVFSVIYPSPNKTSAITITSKILFLIKRRPNSEFLYWFEGEILSSEAGSSVHL